MTAGAARAEDDDEDDKTFEEKIIEGIMAGIGGTNMENTGHRISRAIAAGGAAQARSAAAGFRRGRGQGAELAEGSRRGSGARPRSRPGRKTSKDPDRSRPRPDPERTQRRQDGRPSPHQQRSVQPGSSSNNPILSPSQLGYTGSFSSMFGGNKAETAPFKGEPTREIADPAADRIPDAVAEFRLRHRAEGIAEQGIQPDAAANTVDIVDSCVVSRLRDASPAVARCTVPRF